MPIVLEKTKETNDLKYPPLDAKNLNPLADFILVQWQFCQDKLRCGEYVLIRPDTHKKMHYTGTVIAVGPEVDEDIREGDRLVFDQFSNFEKYWDETYGRVALLQESKQTHLFMIVPRRVEIEGQEPEFNYDQ